MDSSENSPFTICGFSSPHRVQWMNLSKALTLSELFAIIGMVETPRILEIAVSWSGGHQRVSILNIKKDIHHQHCCFDIAQHQPRHQDDDDDSSTDDEGDDNDDFDSMTISEEKKDDIILRTAINSNSLDTTTSRKELRLQLVGKMDTMDRTQSSPLSTLSYPQCMDRYDHIPIHNDYIPKTEESPPSTSSSPSSHTEGGLDHELSLHKERRATAIGHCLALEELFSILCWTKCPKLAVKMQFADKVTIQMATDLVQKYSAYFQLDSISCLWYHGVLLHHFPMSNARHSLKKVFGATDPTTLSFTDFVENIKRVPALTYSLSWPSHNGNVTKSPNALKLCLSSILSEIAIGKEHDIVVHFPIQHIYDCCHIVNSLITNKSYFPYLAFNFFNVHRNPHNFDFSDPSNTASTFNSNLSPNRSSSMNPKSTSSSPSSSSWNLFRRGDKSKTTRNHTTSSHHHNNEHEMVYKTTLNWLSTHIDHLFCFTSITRVRLKSSPNEEFRKILGRHRVQKWNGRLSWNPRKTKREKSKNPSVSFKEPPLYSMPTLSHSNPSSLSPTASISPRSPLSPRSSLRPPDIQWDLWQIARVDAKSKHSVSCIYGGNIGLAPKSGGWLLSTRELRPPYRIKGRFFAGDNHGVLSIYIRCSGIEYPPRDEVPAFGVGVHIGNEKMKMVTHKLQSKPMRQECGIGANRDNSYNFQINDRGPMYPIVYQVERTGKDGEGDNFPKGQRMHVPYPRDSTHWMYYVVFTNASSEWILIDRLQVDEKN